MRTASGVGLTALCVCATVMAGCGQPTTVEPSAVSATVSQASAAQPGGVPNDNASSNALLAAARQATAAYHDVEKATLAGYVPDPVCISSPLGTMGIHALNAGLLGPGVEADRPEALLYLPKPGGGMQLVAVEYLEFVMLRYPDGSVRPWVSPDRWPDTHTVVNAASRALRPAVRRPDGRPQPHHAVALGSPRVGVAAKPVRDVRACNPRRPARHRELARRARA